MARESRRKRDDHRFGTSRARLIDDLRDPAQSWRFPTYLDHEPESSVREFAAMRDRLLERIRVATPIVADNVSNFFFEVSDQDHWNVQEDFPCCAPPFRDFWVEATAPRVVRSHGKVRVLPTMIRSFGTLCTVTDVAAAAVDPTVIVDRARERFAFLRATIGEANIRSVMASADPHGAARALGPGMPEAFKELAAMSRIVRDGVSSLLDFHERTKFILTMNFFLKASNETVCGPFTSTTINLDHDGIPTDQPLFGCYRAHTARAREIAQGWAELGEQIMNVVLLTLSFMNCKNTRTTRVEPDAQLNRARRAHKKHPLVAYHTIDIEPTREILVGQGAVAQHGLRRALHICRGHFARYTAENPLFGHFVGTVWRPSHRRGSIQHGIIRSDYRVGEIESTPDRPTPPPAK